METKTTIKKKRVNGVGKKNIKGTPVDIVFKAFQEINSKGIDLSFLKR